MSRSLKMPEALKLVVAEQQSHAFLGRVDTVHGDLVVDGHQPRTIATVERLAQVR